MDTNKALELVAQNTEAMARAIDKATEMVAGLLVQHTAAAKVPSVQAMLRAAVPALTRLRAKCDEVIAVLKS